MSSRLLIGPSFVIIILFLLMKPGVGQIVGPSSEEKSVIYFLRGYIIDKRDVTAMNNEPPPYINQSKYGSVPLLIFGGNLIHGVYIYDSVIIVAELFESEYIRYECDSGYHLFWTPGSRNEYLEAELLPGKVYLIDVSVTSEGNRADFRQINPDNDLWIDGIECFVSEHASKCYSEKSLQKAQKRKRKEITKGLARMQEDKSSGRQIGKLKQNMFYLQSNNFGFEPD